MAAKHKLSQSHTLVETQIDSAGVAEIAKSVGEQTKGNIAIGINRVRFEGAEPGHLRFSIRALGDRMEIMTFQVTIQQQGAHTNVRTGIGSFKTRQQTMLFIPIAPKHLSGYGTYKLFMNNLATALRMEDPRAQVTLTERVGN
jgi:hypothetical protein